MKLKCTYLLLLLFSFVQNVMPQTGWLKQNPPQSGNITSINFIDQNTGFVCQSANLYKTTNSGINWSLLSAGKSRIQFLNTNNGYSLDTLLGQLHKTTDGGTNWFCVEANRTYDFYFINFETGWISTGEICRTSNGGINWNCISPPSWHASTNAIYFGNVNFGISTGTWYDLLHFRTVHYVFRSINSGINWECVGLNIPPDSCALTACPAPYPSTGCSVFSRVYLINGSAGFLYGGTFNPNSFYRTINTGSNWIEMSANTCVKGFSFVNQNTGYGAGTGKIIYTTDCGNSWSNQYIGDTAQINDVKMINSLTGWAGGNYGVLLKTINGGVITIPPPPVLTSPPNGAIGISLTPILLWLQIFDNEVTYSYRVLIASDSLFNQICDSATVATNSYQVPSGKLQNLTCYYWKARAISSTHGYGPWSPVFHFTTLISSVNIISSEVPNSFVLYQNYPNPFNPGSKIKFQIPKFCGVKLIISDMLGRETAALVNQLLQPGIYEINWDASNYPSGVYFYKITAGDYLETKKMILIK